MLANKDNERFFLRLHDSGLLRVTKSGRVFNTTTNNELARHPNGNGYHAIGWKDPKTKKVRHIQVHRLVVLVFMDRNLDPELEVNHKDGNTSNNRLTNLEICTSSENNRHAWRIGLSTVTPRMRKAARSKCGERGATAKLTNKQARRVRALYRLRVFNGLTVREIGYKFKVSHKTVIDVGKGRSYRRA